MLTVQMIGIPLRLPGPSPFSFRGVAQMTISDQLGFFVERDRFSRSFKPPKYRGKQQKIMSDVPKQKSASDIKGGGKWPI